MQVRELSAGESGRVHAAMVALGREVGTVEEFAARVDNVLRPGGYRLVAAFIEAGEQAAAAAGFRVSDDLVHGRHLFVDDLATCEAFRRRGCAAALMDWMQAEARRLDCRAVSLESGVQRHPAHRFYLKYGFDISAHHFRLDLD